MSTGSQFTQDHTRKMNHAKQIDQVAISAAKLSRLTGLPVYRLAQLAAEGFFARARKDDYELVDAISGLSRFYRESSEKLPIYPSIDACVGATGIPRAAIKSAKVKGCTAFKNTRVSLEPLLRWLFSNDELSENNWAEALKEVQTRRERLKFRKETEELVDKSEVSEGIQKFMAVLASELERQLLHECPPVLKGLDELTIRQILEKNLWDSFAAAKKKLEHLLQENAPAKGGAKPASVVGIRDARFQQLFDLARESNAEAEADLWREYGFRFGEDQP